MSNYWVKLEDDMRLVDEEIEEFEFFKKAAGEFICPLNDGVPVTQYENRQINYLARFAGYLIRRYQEVYGRSE